MNPVSFVADLLAYFLGMNPNSEIYREEIYLSMPCKLCEKGTGGLSVFGVTCLDFHAQSLEKPGT